MGHFQQRTNLITLALVTGTAILLALYPFIATAVFFGVRILSNAQSPLFMDFAVYYYAAERFLQGCSLYLPVAADCPPSGDVGPYLYPPFVILLFVPFAFLPYLPAALTWNTLMLIGLWSGIILLIDASNAELTPKGRMAVLWCATGFAPVMMTLFQGQVTGFLVGGLCLVGAYILTDSHQKIISSSAITAIAVVIKPFYVPAGAYLFRDRVRFAAGLLTVLVTYVLSIVMFDINLHRKYIASALSGGSGKRFTYLPPQEWQPVGFRPFYLFGEWELFINTAVIFILITVAGGAYFVSETNEVDQYVFALGVLGVVLSPGANTYTLSVLVPVYLIMLFGREDSSEWVIRLLVMSILLVHVHPYTIRFLAKFGPRHVHPGLSTLRTLVPVIQPAVWGTLLLLALVLYRLSKATNLNTVSSIP